MQQSGKVVPVHAASPTVCSTDDLSLNGQLEAVKSSDISTRVMGYIQHIYPKVGDQVQAGQLLVTIGQQDIEAKKAQAQAAYSEAVAARDLAQKDYERFKELKARGSATDKELENLSLQYASAKSRTEAARQLINEANAALDYVNVKAPFSGVVTRKLLDEGSIANPGMPILTLEQAGDFQVRFTVPESDVHKISKGAALEVYIKSIGRTLSATVSEISPSSRYSGGQYAVKAQLNGKETSGLYAGMFANVTLSVKKENTNGCSLLVPSSSLVIRDQLTGVFLVRGGKAFLRWIRLGKRSGDQVEVLSGLDGNERIVVNPRTDLYNGATVKVQ